ncbi:CPBP family intramembrane glutamic endopeptidase [Haladaptatus caseinilyticus]|uniref:CPBP family intramembrane glutamic endopeptidase n=1 Tax=Haladaptatus caseinilyticus TaxID=2993314 RepID=UPI00224B1DC0|nr:CPBP family intramembrane glutamic endopeptidase [Haladaptatus caseinilyticus]
MPAPNWNAFTAVTLVVLAILIALARASQAVLTGEGGQLETIPEAGEESQSDSVPESFPIGGERSVLENNRAPSEPDPTQPASEQTYRTDEHPEQTGEQPNPAEELTTGMLLLNVALSQGLFGVILVISAILAAIPRSALGIESATRFELGVGIALGVALFVANELGQRVADALGIEYEDGLRELLTPDSVRGWVLLLGVALPIIAGFEELLFRSALVGVLAVGYDISPWLLAAFSSVAFAVGHGAQGPGGILVTGTLGAVLAAAFVLTGSLLVVVVAHYLVNALEFAVHAGNET